MKTSHLLPLLLAAIALSTTAVAQDPPTDGPFQVMYAANLDKFGSQFDITNTGVNTDPVTGIGDICVNTYVFAYDEQLASCCTCKITRNSLWSMGGNRDLISDILTPDPSIAKFGIVVKLVATQPTGVTGTCDATKVGTQTQGLAAWGHTFHYIQPPPVGGVFPSPTGMFGTETPFINSTLAPAEYANMAATCGFIKANGSGYGICKSCQTGPVTVGSPFGGAGGNNNQGLGADQQ